MIELATKKEPNDFIKYIKDNSLAAPMIVIYHNTLDYPNQYVARIWDLQTPTSCVAIRDTYKEICAFIPYYMIRFNRETNDDQVILETWM